MPKANAFNVVAIILAIGISFALMALTSGAVYSALVVNNIEVARLVAVTQVLTGWGGGIIGVLGAYVGYSFSKKKEDDDKHTG